MKKNIWLDGIMGLVVGDALGCPVQFLSRDRIRERGPVTGMEGYGTYNMPEGTWTDDSSMALAAMDSIIHRKGIDPEDIMKRFMRWEFEGAYTPFGEAFDQGMTCSEAIYSFRDSGDYRTCGKTGEYANGNGALMRILPVCLYYIDKYNRGSSGQEMEVCSNLSGQEAEDHADLYKTNAESKDREAIPRIHLVSGLTHNHLRSQMACGLYYFLVKEILKGDGASLKECLQRGMDAGLDYYRQDAKNHKEMAHYRRLADLDQFAGLPEDKIRSSGYVVDSLEAAIWCLLTTDTFADGLLKAVNLGLDTDTVAAIAGGLAGLYYGYENIPAEWLAVIQKRDYVEEMCRKCNDILRDKENAQKGERRMTMTFKKAEKMARGLKENIDFCQEYEDAFIFSKKDEFNIGGDGPVVILKESGEAINMTGYCDSSKAALIREIDL